MTETHVSSHLTDLPPSFLFFLSLRQKHAFDGVLGRLLTLFFRLDFRDDDPSKPVAGWFKGPESWVVHLQVDGHGIQVLFLSPSLHAPLPGALFCLHLPLHKLMILHRLLL